MSVFWHILVSLAIGVPILGELSCKKKQVKGRQCRLWKCSQQVLIWPPKLVIFALLSSKCCQLHLRTFVGILDNKCPPKVGNFSPNEMRESFLKASYASPLAQTCERSLNDIFGSALFFCQPVFQSRSAAYLIFVISLHSHIFCPENFTLKSA